MKTFLIQSRLLQWKSVGLFFIVLTIAFQASAQSQDFRNDTIRWNATGFQDQIASVDVSVPCEFITYPNGNVDWVQSSGSYVVNFSSTGTTGDWADLSTNGSITVSLASGQLSGQIVFTRTSQGITADLTIHGGSAPIQNSYTISTLDKL